MSWTAIAAQCVFYFILWFFALFIVLPFGIKREDNPELGHDTGAPKNPALLKRFLATSLLAFVLWAIFFYVTVIRGLTLQQMFR
jgi:predicted secreted protein